MYVGIDHTPSDAIEAHYFAVKGFESVGGRSLAEHVVRELPATGIGVVRGMRVPILRETRAPAVVIKLGSGLGAPQHRDLVVTALSRALTTWRAAEEVSTST